MEPTEELGTWTAETGRARAHVWWATPRDEPSHSNHLFHGSEVSPRDAVITSKVTQVAPQLQQKWLWRSANILAWKRWLSNCWEKRIMPNNDQKNNKKVKSAWEVFFFFSNFSLWHLRAEWEPDVWLWGGCEEEKQKWCTGSKHPHRNLKTDLQVTKQSHLSESYSHAEKANSAESWKTSVIRAWFNGFKNELNFSGMLKEFVCFVFFYGKTQSLGNKRSNWCPRSLLGLLLSS